MSRRRTRPNHALDFLARLLAGTRPGPADIDVLLDDRVPEGLHLDYKAGSLLQDEPGADLPGDPKTFAGKMRKYLAGFANSDGGVLVIGVGEPKRVNPTTGQEERDPTPGARRPFEPVAGLDAEAALRRVGEAVITLRPYLASHPRIHAVDHQHGLILVVAVPRSESLVVCLETNKTIVHYLRISDSTVSAPGYLIEDLILGRRRRSEVSVRWANASNELTGAPDGTLSILLNFTLMNESLVWLDDLRVGLLYPSPQGAPGFVAAEITQRARVIAGGLAVMPLRVSPAGSVGPFDKVGFGNVMQLPSYDPSRRIRWRGGLYVAGRDQPVKWFQLEFCQRERGRPPLDLSVTPADGDPIVVGIQTMPPDGRGDWEPADESA